MQIMFVILVVLYHTTNVDIGTPLKARCIQDKDLNIPSTIGGPVYATGSSFMHKPVLTSVHVCCA